MLRLERWLRAKGYRVERTREPEGTRLGAAVRRLSERPGTRPDPRGGLPAYRPPPARPLRAPDLGVPPARPPRLPRDPPRRAEARPPDPRGPPTGRGDAPGAHGRGGVPSWRLSGSRASPARSRCCVAPSSPTAWRTPTPSSAPP